MKNIDAQALARQVIQDEVNELLEMSGRIDSSIGAAVNICLETRGHIVVVGMGKSGIIGRKIAATLSSMGSPAFFVHPGEAFHGDLGMITPEDAVIMISNSGETEELIRLIPFLQHQKNKVIALTGKIESTLGRNATTVLNVGVSREACMLNLAPTSSTTATLVMGDALSVVLSTAKDFQPEDFARFHPGGSLGRRLLTRVKDVMVKDNLPVCAAETSLVDLLQVMNKGRLGLALIARDDQLEGIVTDGDVRRALTSCPAPLELRAEEFMTKSPKTIAEDARLVEAEDLMLKAKISSLVVTTGMKQISGVVQIYS